MKLNDLVELKNKQAEILKQNYTPFGFSKEGDIIHSFQANIHNIQLFTLQGLLSGSIEDQIIRIFLPSTRFGMSPRSELTQPFGWTGKINEYAAEVSVWWAFEILTDNEGTRFMELQRPAVFFHYMEKNFFHELEVRYNGNFWEVLGE